MSLQQVEVLLAGIRDLSGNPLAAGKVYTYAAGTSTPKATYTDSAGSTPAANPVILDAYGRTQIYADGAYKFVVKDVSDVTLYTWDNLYFSRVTTQASQWPDIYGGTSGGAANLFTITAAIAITSYSGGQQFTFIANQTATGASTLNVNGLGAISIVKGATPSALAANDIISGEIVSVIYDSGGGGRFRLISPAIKQKDVWGSGGGGTVNAITISPSPAITAYAAGQRFSFTASGANTGAVTLNVNGLGAKNVQIAGAALVAGQIGGSTSPVEVLYDGTNFQLINPQLFNASVESLAAAGASQGTATAITGATYTTIVNISSGSGGIKLPDAFAIGMSVVVYNTQGSAVNVYPFLGDTIGAAAANTPLSLPSHQGAIFHAYSATAWTHVSTVTL